MWSVVKKELRGYFNSAIAVIFLAAFLAVAFYTFFWREKFFARGLADLRPLFEWMPDYRDLGTCLSLSAMPAQASKTRIKNRSLKVFIRLDRRRKTSVKVWGWACRFAAC